MLLFPSTVQVAHGFMQVSFKWTARHGDTTCRGHFSYLPEENSPKKYSQVAIIETGHKGALQCNRFGECGNAWRLLRLRNSFYCRCSRQVVETSHPGVKWNCGALSINTGLHGNCQLPGALTERVIP